MNTPKLALSNKQIQLITWILLALMPIIGMAVDLVAPSLPAISQDLNQSSSIVKNMISLYLIGYGMGNFTSGILTDSFGRRKLLLGGLLGFIVVSLCAATIPHIGVLLGARFLQGLMLGTISVTLRAILADILPAEKLVALGVMIGMVWGIGPIIGPVIGGYLQDYFGYQAGFYFFGIMGLFGLVACFLVVPETSTNYHPLRLVVLKRNFGELITHKQFIALSALMGLSYSLMIIFNTAGPFLIQTKFHHSAIEFGHIALYLGGVYLIATFINRYLLTRRSARQILFFSVCGASIIALFAVIISYFLKNDVTFISVSSGIMFFATGLIFPLSMGQGLSLFRHIPGYATATMYLINTMITSACAAILSLLNMENGIPLMWTYLFLTGIAALLYWLLIHKTRSV